MTLSMAHVVVDCDDAGTLAGFWSRVLGRPVDPEPNPYFASVGRGGADRPALLFVKVPEAKRAKNRLHLDLTSPQWAAEVDRVVALGAVEVSRHEEYGTSWVTLRDPEGNEFDIGAGLSG